MGKLTLVEFGVGVSKLDRNVSEHFSEMAHRLKPRKERFVCKYNLLTFCSETALTRVDLPCATCPIVPMLIVACLEIISGLSGVTALISKSSRD